MKIDIDTPEKLPLGHAFVPPTDLALLTKSGEAGVTLAGRCQCVVDGGFVCGQSFAAHEPVPMRWWEALSGWLKGALGVLLLCALSSCAAVAHVVPFVPLPPPGPHLAAWTDAMSDGCSAPKLAGVRVVAFTPAETACCVVHDKAYYYGGTATARLAADRALRACFVRAGSGTIRSEKAFLAVRAAGGPEWMQPYSWDFGEGLRDGVWRYR